MDKRESLHWFLVRKFILTAVAIVLSEYALMFFLNHFFFPVMNRMFFKGISWDLQLNVFQIFYILFVTMLYLLFLFLRNINPDSVGKWGGLMWEWFDNMTSRLIPGLNKSEFAQQLSSEQSTILLLICGVSLMVLLLPFIVGSLYYARTIADEMDREQERRELAQKEGIRRRNLMLSDIAHDLRTPMTTVAGYAKALADGMVKDESKKQEYLAVIQQKSKRVEELIQLLFEYTKLDSEGYELVKEPFDIFELARETAASIYTDMEDAGMLFEVDIPEEPLMVEGDALQMSRVITNLLNNAISHNPRGTRIKLYMEPLDEGEWQLVVADSGTVIPANAQERLFEPFAMSDESRNSRGGSGLGLSIAKKIVEMHHWSLVLTQRIFGFTKAFIVTIKIDKTGGQDERIPNKY